MENLNRISNKDFTFSMELKRFSESATNYVVRGVASSTSQDNHKTIFSEQCQMGFVEDVKDPSRKISFEMEHMGDSMFFNIGTVTDAGLLRTAGNNLPEFMVIGELNKKHPFSSWLMDEIDKGSPIGLSIRGNVVESHYEDIGGELIKVFDRVILNKIGITSMPSNPDTYLEALRRSIEIQDEVKIIREDEENLSKNNLQEKMLANILPEVLEFVKNNMAKVNGVETQEVEQVAEPIAEEVTQEAIVQEDAQSTIVQEEVAEDVVKVEPTILEKVESMFSSIKSFIADEFKVMRELAVSRSDIESFSNRLTKIEEEISRAVEEVVSVEEVIATVAEPIAEDNAMKDLKKEIEELRSDLVKISAKPASTPANQIGRSIDKSSVDVNDVKSLEDLDKLLADGKITEPVYRSILWSNFYKTKNIKKLDL